MEVDKSLNLTSGDETSNLSDSAMGKEFECFTESYAVIIRSEKAKETKFVFQAVANIYNLRKMMKPDSIQKILYHYGHAFMELCASFGAFPDKIHRNMFTTIDTDSLVILATLGFIMEYPCTDEQFEIVVKTTTDLLMSPTCFPHAILLSKILSTLSKLFEARSGTIHIREFLLMHLQRATLRKDDHTTATVLTLMLRSFVIYKQYSLAEKLLVKTKFPNTVGNNIISKFYLYSGIIHAVQLDYSTALSNLVISLQNAPQDKAYGFRQMATKFTIIVTLLLGEIPLHSTFKEKFLVKPLKPYYHLTQALRTGEVKAFQNLLQQYKQSFIKDRTYHLVLRLRQNVIKTGIKIISLSYRRISLKDIAEKLNLSDDEVPEFIIAKVIKDGVVDAKINHQEGFVEFFDNLNSFNTSEPQCLLDTRIAFCLDMNQKFVDAMKYSSKNETLAQIERELKEQLQVENELIHGPRDLI